MRIRVGYELNYEFPQPTPMILTLNVHHSRVSDLAQPDHMLTTPAVPTAAYRDGFGNWCTRLVAPAGHFRVTSDAIVNDTGAPDPVEPSGGPAPRASSSPKRRWCSCWEVDTARRTRCPRSPGTPFSKAPLGWGRVQAICDFVHQHIQFGYEFASPTKTAWEVFNERKGVCRDFAHLAITLCRCMNIPARYCTGYLGDIGRPPDPSPMDFAGWFEAYLGGAWHTFDPRNNVPRIGRVLIARGRDAADVAITTTFGPNTLRSFRVWTDEVKA